MSGDLSPLPLRTVVQLGVCAGVLTSVGELGYLALRKYVRHSFLFLSVDVLWMKPAAELIVFVACGLSLVAIGRALRREVSIVSVVRVYVFLGTLGLLVLYRPLHRGAAVVLAAGLGVQAGRLLEPRAERLSSLARHAWVPLVTIPVLVGTVLSGMRVLDERRALARLPEPAPGAPNVLLVVLDTVRSLDLSLYGYSRPTSPRLVGWAKGGTRFERAFSTASWTLPSHASIFTGRLPHELSTGRMTALDDSFPTLAQVLAGRGYATAGFVANTFYCTEESGLGRGFAHYEVFPITVGGIARSSALVDRLLGDAVPLARKDARDVNRGFLGWLDEQRGLGRPFFAFLNYFDAHSAYQAPEPFGRRFLPPGRPAMTDPERRSKERRDWTREELQPAVDAYDGAISFLDAEVGALLAELDRRGVRSRTLVVLTSDHGEEFGEHGMVQHGYSLYRPSVQVPLVLELPGVVPAGSVVSDPVSLRNLPATILDLLPRDRAPSPFPGRSLARFWKAGPGAAEDPDPLVTQLDHGPQGPSWYPAGKGPMWSVIGGGLRYIRNGDGREELYDFESDPLEKADLAARPEYAAALDRLRFTARRYRR